MGEYKHRLKETIAGIEISFVIIFELEMVHFIQILIMKESKGYRKVEDLRKAYSAAFIVLTRFKSRANSV